MCETCGGFGFVTPDVPLTDERFGVSVVCPACGGGDVLAHQRAKQRAAALDLLRRHGLTESQEHNWVTWRDWSAETLGSLYAEKALAVAVARDWAAGEMLDYDSYGEAFSHKSPTTFRFEPSQSAWFHGVVGTGKTSLAYLAYKTRLARTGETGVFIEWADLYSAIRATYGTRNHDGDQAHELTRAVAAVPVLLLDDVGQQRRLGRMSDDEYEKLWLILNHRYIQRLPTLLTSNLDYIGLLDQTDDKLVSRLGQRFVIVPVGGENLRTVK